MGPASIWSRLLFEQIWYAGARLRTIKDLLVFSPLTRIKNISGLYCNCGSPMLMVGVAKCLLCEVVCYCVGSNGTEISVHHTE